HADDPEYNHYESIKELPPHRLNQVRRFFEDYKKLEGKQVVVQNFLGKKEAHDILSNSIKLYKEKKDELRAK
ncbi:MAG: inorganic diphosphatase, partial [Bdellovibrionales bacterium]|nr:inorganic diphosphatase [Bdellovibrionales bacterium]